MEQSEQEWIVRALSENRASLPFLGDEEAVRSLAERLEPYRQELARVNEVMNLTAIKDAPGMALKHFADCLTPLPLIPANARLLDVGSGAGLPALPIAIARPDVRVCAMDSTGKKVNFIRETTERLCLRNMGAVCGRAEELATDGTFRESFDVVTARALARLPVLAELCLPFVKVGGVFLAMKGPQAEEEIEEGWHALRVLGGELEETLSFSLSLEGEEITRTILRIRKTAGTPPLYPRNHAAMLKKPL